jgi:ubiquinone/menaquinone biosynthesis C-methylase UbiE
LVPSDEPNRGFIGLYHSTAIQADISGKQVLEVGCGHGGGASYLTRTLRPASYTGLDLNPAGVAFCQKRHKDVPGLNFVRGNAEDLPFPNESFDAVINVESSNHYPHLSKFLSEVARVLRPGGHFLYTDSHHPTGIPAWEATLAEAPLRMLSKREINEDVMRGMDQVSRHWLGMIDRRAPAFMRRILRETVPVKGAKPYEDLKTGALSYRMYSFIKD